MDFLCFYFPLFCIHWLMDNYIRLHIAGFWANKKATDYQRLHYSWF